MEFAAEYSDLNELNLPYHEWSFFTYYSLDAILVTLLGLAVVLTLIVLTLKALVMIAVSVWRLVALDLWRKGDRDKKLKSS